MVGFASCASKSMNPEPSNAIPSQPKLSTDPENRRIVFGICVFLAVITLAVFGQTLRHDFVNFDDDIFVYQNASVTNGFTANGIASAFSYSRIDNWIPLTTLSHITDCQLYGLHAGGHHLTDMLLHMASVILLFLALRRMTGALWLPAFVAALFAIHPLHVESVAWVAERKDTLSGLFFMLTLWAYARAKLRAPHSPLCTQNWLVLVFFTLGLMSKPMLVTLPFVLLLLDYWPLGSGEWKKAVVEKIPLFALSLGSCVLTVIAQRHSQTIATLGNLPVFSRIGNALVSYVAYIGQMFYPANLAVFYPPPKNGYPLWEPVAALALISGITLVVFLWRRRSPYLLVGWLWYLGMLAPVIGIIQVGAQAHADRYTYLPQIGLYLMVAWGVAELASGWQYRRAILGAAAATVISVLFVCSCLQAAYWKDSITLWTHALDCIPENAVAHNNLGNIHLQKGELDEAMEHYQKALEFKPDLAMAHDNLGYVFLRKNQMGEAIAHFQKATEIDPQYAQAHNNLGALLLDSGHVDEAMTHLKKAVELQPHNARIHDILGKALLQKRRVDEAMEQFQKALEIQPRFPDAHSDLGMALLQKGRVDEAIGHFQKALATRPDFAQAHNNLGKALVQKSQFDEAIGHFQKAVELRPDFAQARNNLGNVLLQKGQTEEAMTQYEEALKIQPDFFDSHFNLGNIFLDKGRIDEAIEHFQKALASHPDFAAAHFNLGMALLQKGRPDDAAAEFSETLRLNPNDTEARQQLNALK